MQDRRLLCSFNYSEMEYYACYVFFFFFFFFFQNSIQIKNRQKINQKNDEVIIDEKFFSFIEIFADFVCIYLV